MPTGQLFVVCQLGLRFRYLVKMQFVMLLSEVLGSFKGVYKHGLPTFKGPRGVQMMCVCVRCNR